MRPIVFPVYNCISLGRTRRTEEGIGGRIQGFRIYWTKRRAIRALLIRQKDRKLALLNNSFGLHSYLSERTAAEMRRSQRHDHGAVWGMIPNQ